MEENKIMNEEVMDVVEAVPSGGSGLGGKLLGGALIAGVAYAGYKLAKKIKSKKDNRYVQANGRSEADEEEVIEAEVVEKLNKKLND